MKKIQAMVKIYDKWHLHSQLWDSVEEATEDLQKNDSYDMVRFILVIFPGYDQISLKAQKKKKVN